ncbi:hypothetical protein B0H17DRAFT_1285787 [Mycena rosella]|uniref:DUF6589 domain-containing protein n=1 Tax=Mycena rosella TaxID=1033263 RepID=A0AAD7DKA0_MYCRO|nr:hypothetical protein B0H17DRAFT_1285787 [Mycena rosella]
MSDQWDHTFEEQEAPGFASPPPSTPTHVYPHSNQYFTPAPFPYYHHSPFSPVTPVNPSGYLHQPYPYQIQTPDLAFTFAGGFFDGIAPETPSMRQRRKFKWPAASVTTEDRLLVVIRAIRQAGFPTIGSFLAALLERKYNKHSSVYNSVAAFLRGAEADPAHHPVAIVDKIFHHVKSQNWKDGVPEEPCFSLPRYAPLRLDRNLIPPGSNSTRNALIDRALQRILERAGKEANLVIDPIHGCSGSFAVGTTVAVNPRTRKMLDKAALGDTQSSSDPEPVLPPSGTTTESDTSQELPFHPDSADPSASGSSGETVPLAVEPDAESDEDEQEPEDPPLLNSFSAKIGRRDPWQTVTASILVLLYFRYRFALVFPMLIGLFAFTCNANRELVSLLCRLGLAVSYQTTLATLHVLAADADTQLKLLGPRILLLFDNVNKMQRAWQATLGHKDEVKSGTASTAIKLEDVPAGALRSKPLMEKIKQKARLELTVKQLRDDINWPHIRGIGAGTVLRIWLKYLPSLSKHKPAVEALSTVKHVRHPLRLRKADISAMRPTDIEESTTIGAANVLRNHLGQLFMLPVSLFKWMIMICGDQLSIDRIRKIIRYTAKGDTPYEQHKWALPLIQLWHLKWAWQKSIIRLHWYPDLDKGTFGLHDDTVAMGREKYNPEKCDFYPTHHILEDRFEALVLDALRLLCEEKTDLTTESETKLLDSLAVYFDSDGPLSDCSFEQLHEFADTVYDRYMCSAAADDALGHVARDVDVYGQPWSGETVDDEPEALPATSESGPHLKKKAKRSRTTAGPKPARNFSPGDQALVTLCNFMRVTFWYMELCAAIAEGDIGRAFEVIKLPRFSFWGAGATNYGNELLELACNFLYEFSDDLVTAVLNNYLVNPSGRIGHWLELDLLQEHFNFWIKRLFNAKSHDFDSKHLSEAVGLNISGISKLRETFPGLFGLKRDGQGHTDATTIHDINQLGIHFRKNHILEFDAGRNQPTAGGHSATGNEDDAVPMDLLEYPAAPVTVCEGVMDVRAFTTGE